MLFMYYEEKKKKKKNKMFIEIQHCIMSKPQKKEESDWNFAKLKGRKKKRRSI